MTDKESYILNLVMDDAVLRRIAWHKWTSRESIPEEIFLYLAGSWFVHSELGLEHDISMNAGKLRQALDEGGIPYEREEECFFLRLEHIQIPVMADSSGEAVFPRRGGGCARVSLSGPSLVRLVRFVDAALPEVERMVMERALRIEREELASTFASRVLSERLDGLGVLYKIGEYCDHLKVEILLPPDGKLSFSFKAEEVDEVAGHIQDAVSAARTLYDLRLKDLFFRPLEPWDRWAEPYNRNVR